MRAVRIALCWLMFGALSSAWAGKLAADYDGDGKISREEFRNQAARTAFDADKNHNGVIDDDEYPLTDAQRRALDKNGDGSITVEEFEEGQLAGFDALDKNGDGFLDASEMKAKR
jgi:Ca2+-binding EF-hand superfamily protein